METFKKRQKEMKRLERRQDKTARRVQRQHDRVNAPEELGDGQSATPSDSPEASPATDA
jgi:hypothetical protein